MEIKNKFKFLLAIIIISFILCFHYYRVTETILDIGDTDAEAVLTTAVYSVLTDVTGSTDDMYGEFFSFVKDDNGNVECFISNGIAINLFTADIALAVCDYLDSYARGGVSVPWGVFTGMKLFAGFGETLKIDLIKISSTKCDMVSTFTQAGINQVKHSLYLHVTPDVTLKTVGRSRQVITLVQVLLYENLIVGEVPDTYLGATITH